MEGFLEHNNNNIIMAANSQEQLALSLTTQSSVGVWHLKEEKTEQRKKQTKKFI